MHVKLEVETQPLTNLWVKLRRVLKLTLFFGSFIFVNLAIGILTFSYLPDLSAKRHHGDPSQGLVLAWLLTISITILLWGNVISSFMEGREEARRRAEFIE